MIIWSYKIVWGKKWGKLYYIVEKWLKYKIYLEKQENLDTICVGCI